MSKSAQIGAISQSILEANNGAWPITAGQIRAVAEHLGVRMVLVPVGAPPSAVHIAGTCVVPDLPDHRATLVRMLHELVEAITPLADRAARHTVAAAIEREYRTYLDAVPMMDASVEYSTRNTPLRVDALPRLLPRR